jgi:hypothetical protein
MTVRKRSAEEMHLEVTRVDQRYKTLRTLIKSIAVCVGIYLCQGIVKSVAGRTTEIIFSLLANVSVTAAFTLTGFAALWAVGERYFRYKKVEYLTGRVRDLELRLDRQRSSSQLTPQGRTNPLDRESDS